MQMAAVCSPKTLDHSNLASLSYPHLIAAHSAQMVTSQDDLKRIAAHRAVELVKSGMVLGLGTGSTAIHALERIADLLNSGKLTDIVGVPTSKKTEGEARALGIPLVDLESNPNIDLSIDGADEVDPFLNLIKGRGGSLLREKMIEGASKRFVVIVDESKWVEKLGGSKMAVPVEVIPFGWKYTLTRLKKTFEGKVGFDARLRMKGEEIFVTDNLNYIIDLFFVNGIEGDLDRISNEILGIVGVVEHGMFLGMATEVIIAGRDGLVVKTRGEVDAAAEQRRMTTKVKKEQLTWTQAMDNILVDALQHQHIKGNRVGGSFTSYAYDQVLQTLKQHYPDILWDKVKVQNHIKIIKKNWSACYDIFKDGLSGFAWDPKTSVWLAETEVWDKLIEKRETAREWMNKPIPNYDKLMEIFGKDRATGQGADTNREVQRKRAHLSKNNVIETIVDINDMASSNKITLDMINAEAFDDELPSPDIKSEACTLSKKQKVKDVEGENFEKSTHYLGEVLERATYHLGELQCASKFSSADSELLDHLVELGFEGDELLSAQTYLLENPIKF